MADMEGECSWICRSVDLEARVIRRKLLYYRTTSLELRKQRDEQDECMKNSQAKLTGLKEEVNSLRTQVETSQDMLEQANSHLYDLSLKLLKLRMP